MITTTLFILHIAAGLVAYAAELSQNRGHITNKTVPLISLSVLFGSLLAVSSASSTAISVALHALIYIGPLYVIVALKKRPAVALHSTMLALSLGVLSLTALLGY